MERSFVKLLNIRLSDCRLLVDTRTLTESGQVEQRQISVIDVLDLDRGIVLPREENTDNFEYSVSLSPVSSPFEGAEY